MFFVMNMADLLVEMPMLDINYYTVSVSASVSRIFDTKVLVLASVYKT